MIKDFLILNCIGKDDKIGIKINGKFFIHDFDQKVNKNDQLVLNILNLVKKYKVNLDNKFSIIIFLAKMDFSFIICSFRDDIILYDRHAGHKIEVEKETYHVIKAQDVVVVL